MRRSLYVVLFSLLLAMAGCGLGRGDPDPGGSILDALKSIEPAVPDEATDVTPQYAEAKWDSCDGRADTAGWSDIGVYISFHTNLPPEALIQYARGRMEAVGWSDDGATSSALGPSQEWTQTLADGTQARAGLSPGTRDLTTIIWQLSAIAPPHGQRVSGC